MINAQNPWWLRSDDMTKYSLLKPEISPPRLSLNAQMIRSKDDLYNVTFPKIFKPNECTTSSRGVAPIHNIKEGIEYIEKRDKAGLERTTLAQSFYKGQELSVFYVRYPYMSTGFIKTLGYRLKIKDSVLHTYGITTRNDLITRKTINVYDIATKRMHGFYTGRIDTMVPLEDSENVIKNGDPDNFHFLDINGNAIGCIDEKPIHLFGRTKYEGMSNELRRVRTQFMQFYIGGINILIGNARFNEFFQGMVKLAARFHHCRGAAGHMEHWFARE
jgi:hypothetical protein